MAVAVLGWSTLAEAESYFADERLETTTWDDLASDDIKNKALNMAYNRIYYHPDFTVPAAGSETVAEKVKLIKIQSEMAYYLAVHLAGEDRRKGIQVQGVTNAGIVKEKYNKDTLDKVPIPPIVEELLDELGAIGETMVMIPIDRDPNEDMSVDVVEED